jgi:hypothetical protein
MITAADIQALLASTAGVTMASITTETPVPMAAANRGREVLKRTVASVQLFNGIKDFNIYANAVKRSSGEDFVASDNWHEHTACWSIVKHKNTGELYLYVVYNKTMSTEFTIDGLLASRQDVAALQTPSAARTTLAPPATVYNVTNDVEHDVIVRTIKLANVLRIAAAGKELLA